MPPTFDTVTTALDREVVHDGSRGGRDLEVAGDVLPRAGPQQVQLGFGRPRRCRRRYRHRRRVQVGRALKERELSSSLSLQKDSGLIGYNDNVSLSNCLSLQGAALKGDCFYVRDAHPRPERVRARESRNPRTTL